MNNYEYSNSVSEVRLKSFDKKYLAKLLTDTDRYKDSKALLDYLCKKFGINNVSFILKDMPQPHSIGFNNKLKSKTMGLYKRSAVSRSITIWNKTAIKQNEVSIKEYADTLLHEFIHHYDYEVLKIEKSIHSAGFYKRISDLKTKLS